MANRATLRMVLDDDTLTRGLRDEEASWLIRSLCDWVERPPMPTPGQVRARLARWRGLIRFLDLWCYQRQHGAALQLAASQQYGWPLPPLDADPFDLLLDLLAWEENSESSA